ncbi:NADH-quinone oxidoreductase subunit NuoG [Desulfatirhabdium butyrativorans]|uniref:NADH-quinone oxidoreductase subunit NuoG n=1 Tax=Desulfatirhabdium butyrativorans TaxID=340467 RepID=UPI0004120F55|nr:NADH-quinone oxidoreductase subunit NuoG [Desulfatirhabdium butyrativorans]
MPKLIIDHREIEVPQGTKVIEAAERLGIQIPRFCYHPALGSVGACRMCAVSFVDGPVKGIQMSCMVDARDGMAVSTDTPEVMAYRSQMIEWLMLNHPHDCPVCDEGGHCLLQDMTISGAHGSRRYMGPKRTYIDQDLGPLVQQEMNRCIHCYRCVRFYQEVAGGRDFGTLGIGRRVFFGRFAPGALESPFSGNLIDLCPTGVLTDKPSRYAGRRWDFQRSPGICLSCSLGCHLTVSARYRAIVRQEARCHEDINGYFLCDRGRYGFFYASAPERPRTARIGAEKAKTAQAVDACRERIDAIVQAHGKTAIAVLSSGRASMETLLALRQLCRHNGWRDPILWPDKLSRSRALAACAVLDETNGCSLKDIETADLVLLAALDPLAEAPMAALSVRQAERHGAGIWALDPRAIRMPCSLNHLALQPDEIAECLIALAERIKVPIPEGGDGSHTPGPPFLPPEPLVDALLLARKPVVLFGAGVANERVGHAAGLLVESLRKRNIPATIFPVLPQADTFGAALLGEGGLSLEETIADIGQGLIHGLVVIEADPIGEWPDAVRTRDALKQLDLLICADCLPTSTASLAHIFLPTQTVYESGGSYINTEGRLQGASAALQAAQPLLQTSQGQHPPRQFSASAPGNDPVPAWQVAAALVEMREDPPQEAIADDFARPPMSAEAVCRWIDSPAIALQDGKFRFVKAPNHSSSLQSMAPAPGGFRADDYELLPVEATFGTEVFSMRSPCLASLAEAPRILLAPSSAEALALKDGDRIRLELPDGMIDAPIHIEERMAPHCLVLCRTPKLAWQAAGFGRIWLSAGQIHRVQTAAQGDCRC